MFDSSKLEGRIRERYHGVPKFAEEVGVHQNLVYRKLHGEIQIHRDDILLWSRLLGIKEKEIPEYFLRLKSK